MKNWKKLQKVEKLSRRRLIFPLTWYISCHNAFIINYLRNCSALRRSADDIFLWLVYFQHTINLKRFPRSGLIMLLLKIAHEAASLECKIAITRKNVQKFPFIFYLWSILRIHHELCAAWSKELMFHDERIYEFQLTFWLA